MNFRVKELIGAMYIIYMIFRNPSVSASAKIKTLSRAVVSAMSHVIPTVNASMKTIEYTQNASIVSFFLFNTVHTRG